MKRIEYKTGLVGWAALLFVLSSLVLFTGCGKREVPEEQPVIHNEMNEADKEAEDEKEPEEAGSIRFEDELGIEVIADNPERIAVLSGSYADAWLLAGGTLTAATKDAEEVIRWEEDMIMLGDLKNPSMEVLIESEIDFIILSASIEEHVNLRSTLENAGITPAYFAVETFEDYDDMMRIMTDITGRKDLYKENVEKVRLEIEAQMERADGSHPAVLFLRAYSTGVKAKGSDSMTGRMLENLGCINIADNEKGLLEDLSMEAVIDADPDYIFVTTMGESQETAMDMVDTLLVSNPVWSGLKAVESNQYYVLPKELFHNKPNERWGESYRILADHLYGEK